MDTKTILNVAPHAAGHALEVDAAVSENGVPQKIPVIREQRLTPVHAQRFSTAISSAFQEERARRIAPTAVIPASRQAVDALSKCGVALAVL